MDTIGQVIDFHCLMLDIGGMKKKNHDPDNLIRKMVKELELSEAFFRFLLPDHIKQLIRLKTLRPAEDAFADEALQEYFSDTIFEVELNSSSEENPQSLLLLVEYVRDPDEFLALQLMEYLLESYCHQAEQEMAGKRKMRPILPLVFYYGPLSWQPKTFPELFEPINEILKEYIPDVPFLFFSLTDTPDEEILNMG